MLLTKNDLLALKKPKSIMTEKDVAKKRLEILKTVKPDMTIHEIQDLLNKNGIYNSVATVRRDLNINKIKYTKLPANGNKKKKGAPIIIGKV
jgi:arginine repressor